MLIRRIILFILTYLFISDLKAQKNFFDSNEIVTVDIVTDLRALFRDINPETAKYHPGFISYIDNNGNSITINVKLKTRGIFRRSRENCNLPPLTIKFNDESLDSSIFMNQNKLKLVNACYRKRDIYKQYVIKEYLAYRIYNVLTDYSFRVRMVKIVYVDINNSIHPFESVGFLIEDINTLNSRTNSKHLKTLGIIQDATDRKMIDIVTVYQYLIGNTDWSVLKQHNIKLIVNDSSLIPIAIPYDFDFCGFVNPPYTKPPEIIPIKHVTDRYYRGFCRTREELAPTFQFFIDKQKEIYNLIIEDTLLTPQNRKATLKYIDEFYKVIKDHKLIQREFIDNCRSE